MAESTYAAAGVDIDAQDRAIALFKGAVRSTYTADVVTGVGSFGGVMALDPARWRQPLLVSSIDSVGTKVQLASQRGQYRSVGHDIVNHCVNDIAVMGAEPLFFMDYYGTGRLAPEAAAETVTGLSEACRAVGCVLLGGELAELPGMYPEGVFDLVGCIVGAVERDGVIDGSAVADGDAILGLGSSGLHTNGYSLARKVLLADAGHGLDTELPELGRPLGDVLLEPHRCYLPAIRALREAGLLKAAAHITGGGIVDNLPRVLPRGLGAEIRRGTWPVPPVFELIQRLGRVADGEMFRTFNMGLGMLLVVGAGHEQAALAALGDPGYAVKLVGQVSASAEGVQLRPANGASAG